MGPSSINFIEFGRTQSALHVTMQHDFDPGSQAQDEHPFVEKIRRAVLDYRLRSAAHFQNYIAVDQAKHVDKSVATATTNPWFQMQVKFTDFKGPISCICRPKLRKYRGRYVSVPNRIQVLEDDRLIALTEFLAKSFPTFPDQVSNRAMRGWWAENGKHFPWGALPAELKERIITFCLSQLENSGPCVRKMRRHRSHFASYEAMGRELGVYEIIDKLDPWDSLLGVSHQVRAITLRLCFVGTSDMLYGRGFCLFTSSYRGLSDAISRLDRYYQMIEPNSLPKDDKDLSLAHCYKHYPNIYPNLKQYATFAQGIRKLCIKMDFMSYLHFFKVSKGGFKRYWEANRMTYEVFSRLPHLREIKIRLPLRPYKGWRDPPTQRGPDLFHANQPCPRLLHRVIYERIAKVLAQYAHVTVKNLGDAEEAARFAALRVAYRSKLHLTNADLDDLYVECGGGIRLEKTVQQEVWRANTDDRQPISKDVDNSEEDFFPPKCRCEVECRLIYNEKERR